MAFNYNSINLLIENCKFTNINIGGTAHNSVDVYPGQWNGKKIIII